MYSNEHEHARVADAKAGGGGKELAKAPATHRSLAGLGDLVKGKPKR